MPAQKSAHVWADSLVGERRLCTAMTRVRVPFGPLQLKLVRREEWGYLCVQCVRKKIMALMHLTDGVIGARRNMAAIVAVFLRRPCNCKRNFALMSMV